MKPSERIEQRRAEAMSYAYVGVPQTVQLAVLIDATIAELDRLHEELEALKSALTPEGHT